MFTQLLLPGLVAATDASPSHEKARVVTVSSVANYLASGLDFDAIADGPGRTKYATHELYYKSKFVSRIEILALFLVAKPVAGQHCDCTRASAPIRRQDRVY